MARGTSMAKGAAKQDGKLPEAAKLIIPKEGAKSERLDPTKKSSDVQKFESALSSKIIGQPDAVAAFVSAYQTYTSGLHPRGRPIAVFLLAGPTGVGKTRLVEASAEILLGSPQAMIKVNCAEFHLPHETAKLIGAPPGYLGFREMKPVLSQENIDHFHTDRCKLSFVLFDEIEKANESLWQILLGVLDKGSITLGDNKSADLSNCVIAMTSNLGAREMDKLVTGSTIGFHHSEIKEKTLTSTVLAQIQKKFTPEFVNRIDRTIVFNRLGRDQFKKIMQIELDAIQNRVFLASSTNGAPVFMLRWSPAFKEFVLDKGTDLKSGARELKRVLERDVILPLSNLISSASIGEGDIITVDVDSSEIVFYREA